MASSVVGRSTIISGVDTFLSVRILFTSAKAAVLAFSWAFSSLARSFSNLLRSFSASLAAAFSSLSLAFSSEVFLGSEADLVAVDFGFLGGLVEVDADERVNERVDSDVNLFFDLDKSAMSGNKSSSESC